MGEEDNRSVWVELRQQRDILIRVETHLSGIQEFKAETNARLAKLEERRFPWPVITGILGLLGILVMIATLALNLRS